MNLPSQGNENKPHRMFNPNDAKYNIDLDVAPPEFEEENQVSLVKNKKVIYFTAVIFVLVGGMLLSTKYMMSSLPGKAPALPKTSVIAENNIVPITNPNIPTATTGNQGMVGQGTLPENTGGTVGNNANGAFSSVPQNVNQQQKQAPIIISNQDNPNGSSDGMAYPQGQSNAPRVTSANNFNFQPIQQQHPQATMAPVAQQQGKVTASINGQNPAQNPGQNPAVQQPVQQYASFPVLKGFVQRGNSMRAVILYGTSSSIYRIGDSIGTDYSINDIDGSFVYITDKDGNSYSLSK